MGKQQDTRASKAPLPFLFSPSPEKDRSKNKVHPDSSPLYSTAHERVLLLPLPLSAILTIKARPCLVTLEGMRKSIVYVCVCLECFLRVVQSGSGGGGNTVSFSSTFE